jgi:hypothetical protein
VPTTRKLCYPHPRGANSHPLLDPPPYGLHPTAGLANNWAIDFMAPGGTPTLAVEQATIWRYSGHNPNLGEVAPGIFGWNIFLHTRDGLIYFYTHLGDRTGAVGDKVPRGKLLGHVGHWPDDEPRSHTHLGVTHPAGMAASKRAIRNVAAAPRITPV